MQKPQAVGSIWNVNSWHWEMKNYSLPAKKILQEKILAIVFDASPELKIKHTKVTFDKAECQINIRKGKQILVYDFQLDLQVFAQHQEEDDSAGGYKIKEILSDDLNDMLIEDVRAKEKNKTAEQLKKWIKKNAKAKIIEVFKLLEEELVKKEGDPQKLQEDKRKREEMLVATQKAREEKGAQKERLLDQQRDKERRLKEEAYTKHFQEATRKQSS